MSEADHTPPASHLDTGEAKADVDKILADLHMENTAQPVRELMASAWYYGYTTGMGDSAKFREVLAADNGEYDREELLAASGMIGHHRLLALRELRMNQRTTASPWATDALLQIIDVLWGELPADSVIALAGTHPEIVDACRNIHQLVNHS